MNLAPIKQLLEPGRGGGGGGCVVYTKPVAMSMINKGEINNCIALNEFTTSRVDSDIGGEHAYVWYYEGKYDSYFQAPNFDWYIIKKTDHQCMLLFCDRILYFLCTFFAFDVFFIHGGLLRNGISDAITDIIFTHLHNTKK